MNDPQTAEWYYVGHYGQLGPLTTDQMAELSRDGVVMPDTYVWRPNQGDWLPAVEVAELRRFLQASEANLLPPPPPPARRAGQPLSPGPVPPVTPAAARVDVGSLGAYGPGPMGVPGSFSQPLTPPQPYGWGSIEAGIPKSDKNVTMAGLLNLIPGVGRFYLGYAAHGALQMVTAFLCGVGFLWSILDGIYILAGGVKYDGYGRRLGD